MKELIHEKLNKMTDLEQRKMLKDIMAGFFYQLIEHQDEVNKELEARVFNEIEDAQGKYDVYFTVCHKQEVDPFEQFLYPVFPEEMEVKKYDMKKIALKVRSQTDVKLFSVFMKCGIEEIKKLAVSKKSFQGVLVTDKNKYTVKARLEQSTRYPQELENLYAVFQKNGIPWKTMNNPYANKFFDVILTGCEGQLNETEEIREINFQFGEYEQYKMNEMVLMWNIERQRISGSGFPVPADDRVNFEHTVSLSKLGLGNGYLVDGDAESPVRYIKRAPEELVIVSPSGKAGAWTVFKIVQPPAAGDRKYPFELVSNKRKDSFINRFAGKHTPALRTRGEIERLASSFEVSKYFELQEIEIKNASSGAGATYDANAFIVDDIRAGWDQKVMCLKFRALEKESFILMDLLSFIVSEIQMVFPEFRCEGELV